MGRGLRTGLWALLLLTAPLGACSSGEVATADTDDAAGETAVPSVTAQPAGDGPTTTFGSDGGGVSVPGGYERRTVPVFSATSGAGGGPAPEAEVLPPRTALVTCTSWTVHDGRNRCGAISGVASSQDVTVPGGEVDRVVRVWTVMGDPGFLANPARALAATPVPWEGGQVAGAGRVQLYSIDRSGRGPEYLLLAAREDGIAVVVDGVFQPQRGGVQPDPLLLRDFAGIAASIEETDVVPAPEPTAWTLAELPESPHIASGIARPLLAIGNGGAGTCLGVPSPYCYPPSVTAGVGVVDLSFAGVVAASVPDDTVEARLVTPTGDIAMALAEPPAGFDGRVAFWQVTPGECTRGDIVVRSPSAYVTVSVDDPATPCA